MITESFNTQPLQNIMPSYLYFQYQNDDNLQAFVDAYNEITQNYLNWFNTTPLSVYTASTISGPLLDWVGKGLYNYARPAFITPPIIGQLLGGYGFSIMGEQAYATIAYEGASSGSAVYVNDDIYKRALTWHLYLGDGRQMTIPWLKRRIARFLYGANGSDISNDELKHISVLVEPGYTDVGAYGTEASYGTVSFGCIEEIPNDSYSIVITIPDIPTATAFKLLFDNGFLAKPFQLNFEVIIS
jgi:hypothetical protein